MIPEFLKDFNLVYAIGIISAISSALWAYRKFLYEKQLEKFKDANINLFKTDKQEVLAAIATLAFFNRDRKFKQNTIDILLSRLYTELDYDITNAIAGALIQYSNRRELRYIADELVGINRNFYFQTEPTRQMIYDLNKNWILLNQNKDKQAQLKDSNLELEENNLGDAHLLDKETASDINKDIIEKNPLLENYLSPNIVAVNADEIKQKMLAEHLRIYPKELYELTWHKQITGDTYSRIMRKASREPKLFRRQLTLEMKLFQNDFNYTHLAKINTSKCVIENSALSSVYFTDVVFSNIKFIKDSTFSGSSFRNCAFNKGNIIGSCFIDCKFDNVIFNSINFKESFFCGSSFSNCRFINCKNIQPEIFFEANFDDFNTTFVIPELSFSKDSIFELKSTAVYENLSKCKDILEIRRTEVRDRVIPKIAEEWLELTDADKFAESWADFSAEIKEKYTKSEWQALLRSFRKEVGKIKSRKLTNSFLTGKERVAFDFVSIFTKQPSEAELLDLKLEKDGKWRIERYTNGSFIIE